MDNYKEKYENLIEKLKKEKEEHGGYTFSSVIDKIVPELKESEDERIRKEFIEFLKKASEGNLDITIPYETFGKWLAWLKSLKPNHWKPSEEQMEELEYVTRGNSYPHLTSLYQDLKNL